MHFVIRYLRFRSRNLRAAVRIEGGNPSAPAGHLPEGELPERAREAGLGRYTREALVRCVVGGAYGGRFVNRHYGKVRTAYTQPPFVPP